jgi:hypothetical protein
MNRKPLQVLWSEQFIRNHDVSHVSFRCSWRTGRERRPRSGMWNILEGSPIPNHLNAELHANL